MLSLMLIQMCFFDWLLYKLSKWIPLEILALSEFGSVTEQSSASL